MEDELCASGKKVGSQEATEVQRRDANLFGKGLWQHELEEDIRFAIYVGGKANWPHGWPGSEWKGREKTRLKSSFGVLATRWLMIEIEMGKVDGKENGQ